MKYLFIILILFHVFAGVLYLYMANGMYEMRSSYYEMRQYYKSKCELLKDN